jgi:hypothetical protein
MLNPKNDDAEKYNTMTYKTAGSHIRNLPFFFDIEKAAKCLLSYFLTFCL